MSGANGTDIAKTIGAFLLDLEPLAVGFRLVMLVVMLSSALMAVLSLVRWGQRLPAIEARYQRNESNSAAEEPLVYLRRCLGVESLQHRLEPVPSILLTIGILGTFLGLGVAISQAAPALAASSDPASVREALTNLLHTVSFKFQVSAWGVIFSLVFPLLVRLPVDLVAERKLAEAVLRLSAAHRPPHVQMVQAIENAFGRLEGLLHGNVLAMTQGSQEMTRQVAQLAGSVAELKDSVSHSSANLQSSALKLGSVGGKIDTSLQRVAEIIGQKLDQSNQSLSFSIGEQNKSLSISLAAFASESQKATVAQTRAADAQAKLLAERLTSMSSQLGDSLKTMNAGLSKSLDEQIHETKTMMKELANENRNASQAQVKASQQQSAALSKQLDSFSNEAQKASEVQKRSAEDQSLLLQQGLEKLLRETKTTMASQSQETSKASQAQIEAARQQTAELSKQLGDFRNNLGAHLTAQQTATTQMSSQFKGTLDKFDKSLENINKYQANLQTVMAGQEEKLQTFNGHIGSLLNLLQQIQERNAGAELKDLAKIMKSNPVPGQPKPTAPAAGKTNAYPGSPSPPRSSGNPPTSGTTPDEDVI